FELEFCEIVQMTVRRIRLAVFLYAAWKELSHATIESADQRLYDPQHGAIFLAEAATARLPVETDLAKFAMRQLNGNQHLFHSGRPAMCAVADLLLVVAANLELAIMIRSEIIVGRQFAQAMDPRLQPGQIGIVDRIEDVGAFQIELQRPLRFSID